MSRILHVVEAFGGGVVTYLLGLTNGQIALGHSVTIAYGFRAETPTDFKERFNARINWVEVKNFHRNLGLHDLKALHEISSIAKSVRPDIVHAHSSKAGMLCRILFLCDFKIRQFYTPHGFPFLMTNISRSKRAFFYMVEKIAAVCSRCTTIACGEGEYEEARKLSMRSCYVNNGVSPREMSRYASSHTFDPNNICICTVGRILEQKNPGMFNQVAESCPDEHFVWIGGGLLEDQLKSNNIEKTGWLSHGEAMQLLADSDIFILTSLWEGLSISLLEAMCLGKLCIVTDIKGMDDVIANGRNGFICRTAEDFAEVIRKVKSGEISYKAVTEAAHAEVLERFNADFNAQEYDKIYGVHAKA